MTETFRYRAVTGDGVTEKALISAESRAEALARLNRNGRTVLLLETTQPSIARPGQKSVSREDSELALLQLATMTRAGVELLEALSIVADSFAGKPLESAMRSIMASLRQGDRLAQALRSCAALSYPDHVYTIIEAGEASGRLPAVLEDAARHLEADRLVVRDLRNALVYPMFLLASGGASIAFLLYAVVPRFAEMLGRGRGEADGLAAFVLAAGVWFHANAVGAIIVMAALVLAIGALLRTPAGAEAAAALGAAIPGVRGLLLARQRAAWSRTMAVTIGAGVDVIQAAEISAGALDAGALRAGALSCLSGIRAGEPLDAAFLKGGVITPVGASLVRAGQRSGQLAAMLSVVATRSETDMRQSLKRLTLVAEPIAIATVAGMIGAIVIGLVLALISVYDSIG